MDNRTLYREHEKFEEDARDGETNVRVTGGVVTTSQLAALDDDDIALPAMSPHGETYLASHDYTTQSDRVAEVDPVPEKYEYSTIDSKTTATATYDYYIPMAGYERLDLHLEVGAGTVTMTVFGSIRADGTAPASLPYIDVGTVIYGAASWTADAMLIDDTNMTGAFNYVKVTVVASSGTFDLFAKKHWR